ncbi:cupin domain-containing protein [Parasphingorhabdus pacifica]
MTTQHKLAVECRTFGEPDEIREFENGHVELLNMVGGTIGRMVLHPGWQWSRHVRPIAGTEWCEAPHFQYHVAGTIHVQMSDGTEFEAGPGSVSCLPQGHDAWVVGDDDVVLVDWFATKDYAKET